MILIIYKDRKSIGGLFLCLFYVVLVMLSLIYLLFLLPNHLHIKYATTFEIIETTIDTNISIKTHPLTVVSFGSDNILILT